jgi:hypothetical protein
MGDESLQIAFLSHFKIENQVLLFNDKVMKRSKLGLVQKGVTVFKKKKKT